MTKFSFDATQFVSDLGKLRSTGVTMENKGNDVARWIFGGFRDKALSKAEVESNLLAVYGNPKDKRTGNASKNLSAIKQCVGGEAVYRAVRAIYDLWQDYDRAEPLQAVINEIDSFIDQTGPFKKGVHALKAAVKGHVKAADTTPSGEEESEADTQADTQADTATPAPNTVSLDSNEAMTQLADMIAEFTPAQVMDKLDGLAALYAAIRLQMPAMESEQIAQAA